MYATVDDLKKRLAKYYAKLYRDDEGAVDETLMADDLSAASVEIDGYLANRYQVPVSTGGALALLKGYCLTLCEELAFMHGAANDVPDKVTKRVEGVRSKLNQIADGKFLLPSAPPETAAGAGSAAIIDCAEPLFTRDQLQGY